MGTSETFTFYIGPWYQKSPFYEGTKRAGCKSYGLYNHMLLPVLYEGIVPEYWTIHNDVALWDVAVERIVEITGPDAFKLTNMLTCRDLTKCEVMQAKYALMIAEDGGIVNDPVLVRLGENHFWLALADSDAGLWARGVGVAAGLDVTVREPEVYPVQVQGPKSKEVIRSLLGDDVANLRYYFCAEGEIDGIPVLVSRTGWTGEVGYEVYLRDASRGDDLWEAILAAGEPHGLKVTAPNEARRIEAGIFNYRSDMNIENNPFEVSGLERLVEQQNADYAGKDALERIRNEGVSRKLVGIDMGGEDMSAKAALNDFWPVTQDGKQVGRVTACSWSPRLEKNVGYAWVPIELAEPGTELTVAKPDGNVPATVTALPFVDPTKETPKS
ncbi:MAG: glycine cleavage T C-terminal barrel domain-containing protein [Actinomycetota bacterium]